MSDKKVIIGRTEHIVIPSEGARSIRVKIDTGADRSSIWASNITMSDDGKLSFTLFAPESKYYSGTVYRTKNFEASRVRSAHGGLQVRFRIHLTIILGGKKIRGTFTLADRSKNKYPALIGCKILNKKFLVDVSKGLIRENRTDELTQELKCDPKAFFEKYYHNNPRGDVI
ncbi:ATP-dependent zinc protease [TM7 phylum sp. oral taxon 349]|jgi:hypothetical protein|nr:ATP-dependent zinc protease [TM7 phylum sp. oral taxon 349]TWP20111.1 ATP-dependent zinc protease [TM7 phylum sp. oral taxon 349]